MTRRTRGTGSVRRLASGNWQAVIRLGDDRLAKTFKTQRQAAGWLAGLVRQRDQGLSSDGLRISFGEVLDAWLEVKSGALREATISLYRRLIELYIKPALGDRAMVDLSGPVIQDFYSDLRRREVGARTIQLCHAVLYGCLSAAERSGRVAQNWAAKVQRPAVKKREMAVWSESQVAAFLASIPGATATRPISDRPFYQLAFQTGMRRGELIGLQWSDVDWLAGTVKVCRQVTEPEGGGWNFQEPKTKRGTRTIRLGAEMVKALREHYDLQPLARGFAGERWTENDLVFPNTEGNPRRGYEVSKTFRKLAELAGLPGIRFHDIRHTAASILLLHGEPPVRVAARLGQSVGVLLDFYSHYIPDDQQRAADLMDTITTPISLEKLSAR